MRRFGGRYLLEEPIGDGHFGVVWWGQDADETPVALKLLRAEFVADDEVLASLAAHRALLTSIASPHLVAVHDILLDDRDLAVVMDLVDGPSARAELAALGTFAPSHALMLVADVLAGITALHAAGLAHGDLKTADILIDQVGVAHVTDFGLGSLRGGAGEMWAAANDVHAAGAVLYELIFGTPPVSGADAAGALRAHLEGLPVVSGNLPEASSALLASMLDPDPALRPSAFAAAVVAAEVAGQIVDDLAEAVPIELEQTTPWSPFSDILDTATLPEVEAVAQAAEVAPVAAVPVDVAAVEVMPVDMAADSDTAAFDFVEVPVEVASDTAPLSGAVVDNPGPNELTAPVQPVLGPLFDQRPQDFLAAEPVYFDTDERPRHKLMLVAAGLVAVIVLGGGAAYALTSGGSGGDSRQSGASTEVSPRSEPSGDGSTSDAGVLHAVARPSSSSSGAASVSVAPSGGGGQTSGGASTAGTVPTSGASSSSANASGQTSAGAGSSSNPNLSPSRAVVAAQPSSAGTSANSEVNVPIGPGLVGSSSSSSGPGPGSSSASGPSAGSTPPSSGSGTTSTATSATTKPASPVTTSNPPPSTSSSSASSSSTAPVSTATTATTPPATVVTTPPDVTSSSVAPPSTTAPASISASMSISARPTSSS